LKYFILTIAILISGITQAKEETSVSLDKVLEAKRIIISPVAYEGHKVHAALLVEDKINNANSVCKFLGYSHFEKFETQPYFNQEASSTEGQIEVITFYNEFPQLQWVSKFNTYFSSLTCIK